MLTHRMPYPPNRGDRIRAFHVLKFLSERADIYLGCVADEPWKSADEETLKGYCKELSIHRLQPRGRWIRAAAGMAVGKSVTTGAFYSSTLAKKIQSWTKTQVMDAALLYCSSMGAYSHAFHHRPKRVVVDLVDVDSQKWLDYAHASRGVKKWLYHRESRKIRNLERRLSTDSDAVSVISREEAELFRSWHQDREAHPISNGVDHEYYSPKAIEASSWQSIQKGEPQLVFVGVLDYLPNVQGLEWFCSHVLPLLKREFPGLRLSIVGRRPMPQIKELEKHPEVCVVGEVDDVRPYVLSANVAIAPLQIARGIQNKILEALACGKPVIATSNAAAGIDQQGGLFIANEPEEWVETLRSLQCQKRHAEASHQARNGVMTQYSWSARLTPLLEMLQLQQPSFTSID